jgi:hypothetical protein
VTDIETLLTDHLRQRADAVVVHDDLDSVLAELVTPHRHSDRRPRRGAVSWAAAAVVVVGIGAVAVLVGRMDGAEPPAASVPTTDMATVAPTTVPVRSLQPSSVTVFPVLNNVGETYASFAVPNHAPRSRMVIGSQIDDDWRDTYLVAALNDPAGDAPPGGELVDVDGVQVTRSDYGGMTLWFWAIGDVGIQVVTAPNSDPPPVTAISARKVSETDPPEITVGKLPAGQVVLAGPSGGTDAPYPTVATNDRRISVEVRDDEPENVLLPGDYEAVDINGDPGRVSTRLAAGGTIVAWTHQGHTVVLHTETTEPDVAVDLARRVDFVDRATWDATYEQATTDQPTPSTAPATSTVTVAAPAPTPVQLLRDMSQVPEGSADAAACEVLTDEAQRVAVAADPYGGSGYEWWTAPTRGGGRADLVTQLAADGQSANGGSGGAGCAPAPNQDIEWNGGGGNGPPRPAVQHGGHVNVRAASVVITFPGQEPVQVPINADGYFLTVLPEDPSGPYSHPERIDALDNAGNIVATVHL